MIDMSKCSIFLYNYVDDKEHDNFWFLLNAYIYSILVFRQIPLKNFPLSIQLTNKNFEIKNSHIKNQ